LSDYFQDGDDRLQSPLAGKPDTVRSVSFSTDEMGFLSETEKALVRSAPAGYDLASLIRDLLNARNGDTPSFTDLQATVAEATVEANTTPAPQISFREIPPGF
jgi:hypothetical protein